MSDIFYNNSKAAVQRLAKNSYGANKRRNTFVVLALALTAFMITSVFSLGFSYFDTFQLQQIRLMGTTADVAITNLTEEQVEQLEKSDLIDVLGINQRLGSVDTSMLSDALLGLSWIDEKEWEVHRLPTVSNVQGNYPRKENEIMLPAWVLSQMGISDPQIGMSITLSYQIGNSLHYEIKDFSLSGFYTDYSAQRTGNQGSVYVSKSFAEETRAALNGGVNAMVTFADRNNVKKNCIKLENKINFTQEQTFEIVPSAQADSATIIPAIGLIILFVVISGYLLIYNILYISISKDIRFYGQLKTIGGTKRQIKRIVRWQVMKTSSIGIPLGLAAGAMISLVIVPVTMEMMYSNKASLGTKISFSPFIFVGTIFFALFTAFIGSMKPAKIAGNISPIAALGYIETDIITYAKRKKRHVKLSRMAFQNIFRNRKSAILSYTSLFLGLNLFLVSSGLLSSLSPENFVSQWGEGDFLLTFSIAENENLITTEMLNEIKQINGIENIHVTYSAFPQTTMDVIYDNEVFGNYIDSLNGKSGIDFSDQERLKAYTENFYSGVYGLDLMYIDELNETLEQPIDVTAFENGEIVLLVEMVDAEGKPIFQPGQEITVIGENGEHTFRVAAACLDADFQSSRGKGRGTAPDLYISQNALSFLSSECKIFRIAFDTADSSQDEQILLKLQSITSSSPKIDIQSRYEKREEMGGYILTLRVLAIGLSCVFLLIGIMNFTNTMMVSVDTRKHEFAILESIGMTKKQIKTVLLYEGGYYWLISFVLLITLGTGIYIPLYRSFKQVVSYASFSYPVLPLLIVAGGVFVVCLVVPIITFNSVWKKSVVERLRDN
ncbi:MAG: ABC transporter permease [Lachnospiraceae bacterium]|nr:ABC transporter permease [Lachnospiraceae bacterium]